MCSNILDFVKDRIRSFLDEFCPCLISSTQPSRELEEVRKSIRNLATASKQENTNANKIFTIETIKKRSQTKAQTRPDGHNDSDSLVIEKCLWSTEASDLFLRVGKSVFPVHKFLLSIESEILKTIIDSVPVAKNATTIVTLNGYEADEIKTLLTLVYLPETEING